MQFLGIIFILQVNFISANRLQSLYFCLKNFDSIYSKNSRFISRLSSKMLTCLAFWAFCFLENFSSCFLLFFVKNTTSLQQSNNNKTTGAFWLKTLFCLIVVFRLHRQHFFLSNKRVLEVLHNRFEVWILGHVVEYSTYLVFRKNHRRIEG